MQYPELIVQVEIFLTVILLSPMQNKAISSESKFATTTIPDDHHWISESAYYKALDRNFTSNHDQDDWLEAKKDYGVMLSKQQKYGLISLR